jgi:cytochrome c oxidase assembly protein subunit 11
MSEQKEKNTRLAIKLGLVALFFCGFGFAMVPLYDVICRVAGINGKTNTQAAQVPVNTQVDLNRWVTVEFVGQSLPGVGLELKPETFSMRIHPGEIIRTSYTVTNTQKKSIVGQAIPSVSPAVAAPDFQKIECFCFSQQAFDALQTRILPVVFYVKPELDDHVGTITLSYTFFEAPQQAQSQTNNTKL